MTELLRWVLGCVAVLAVGCGVDAGQTSGGGGGTGGDGGSGGAGLSCPDDPEEGPVPPECGVWVSVSMGEDGADGTQGAPVKTLARAIELAETAEQPRVYACNETWSEAVVVPRHVSLYGGFDCANGWSYGGEKERSMLVSPTAIALTYVADEKEGAPFLMSFYIEAADAVQPGESSYGLFVAAEGIPLLARRCEIYAGNAADGANGDDGAPGGEPAAEGAAGSDGADACSALLSKGGVGPENACEGGTSKGGDGGDAGPMTATNGGTGEPAAAPPAGEGGLGEQLSPACTPGQAGAPGANGASGMGVTLFDKQAYLTEEGYGAAPGEEGKPGAPGQGGGGGGATFGSVAACGAGSPGGAAGGSGAAGGCGGKGGEGGMPGGSSFAIATLSLITVQKSTLTGRNGGNGGNGGAPQEGGIGGLPGTGGAGNGVVKAACAGGSGGKGGPGGWGGGGLGGSTGAMLERPTEFILNEVYLYGGEPGKGGIGDPSDPDTDGGSGNPAAVFQLGRK